MSLPAEDGKRLLEFMETKAKSRKDLLIKIALVAGGLIGIGAIVWLLFFGSKASKKDGGGGGGGAGGSTQQCANLQSEYQTLLIAASLEPDLAPNFLAKAGDVKAAAAKAGCSWAK